MADEIQFKPLTSGLGFHPFSDGLPYAPVSKAPTARTTVPAPMPMTGTGAVAAGPATFVTSPRVTVPVARPAAVSPQPVRPAQTLESPIKALPEPKLGFLYLLKRFCAFTLDLSLNVSLLAAGMSFTLWNEQLRPDVLLNPAIVMIAVLFFCVFHWALVTAQEILFRTSVGKRVFGLSLNGSLGAIFTRAFFFLPSIGFCGVGIVWCLFDRKRRCWHDLVANLQPIEVARL